MPEMIRDGIGRGYLLEINSEHKAQTHAVSQTEEAYVAELYGDAYAMSTGVLNTNSTNPHIVMYFKNLNPEKNMYIAALVLGWNGGNATGEKCAWWDYVVVPGDPVTNYTASIAGNMNLSSSTIALATVDVWNGVGEGITLASSGVVATSMIFGKGTSDLLISGIPILGYNDAIALRVTCEEVGKFTGVLRVFYK
jgi:hypothetical protein